MGDIIRKKKSKVKDFFKHSKKMVQAPKELPEIGVKTSQTHLVPPKQQEMTQTPQKSIEPEPPSPQEKPKKELKLPQIEPSALQEKSQAALPKDVSIHEDDLKQFEEAINNINIDMVHTDAPALHSPSTEKEADYYKPSEMGEGYFSEIEHYVKNKNVKEIIDDILKKDFLTSMKDYHDTKAQGKPFYLHEHDLKHKLKKKMNHLRKLEEEWHNLKMQIEDKERKKKEAEKGIDHESQELKELFRQVKINHLLEQQAPKEHYFKLKNGQELKSLNDLRKALEYISDDEFNHHMNPEKNDFASWVKEALQNQELYEKIKDAKNKEELQEALQNPF
ncbi:hypothetical protein KY348_03505 [Candidatus Woesearchaeota archaeon]|nr:hypothetical protein [Candidatus Woesearchaeota archaeon]